MKWFEALGNMVNTNLAFKIPNVILTVAHNRDNEGSATTQETCRLEIN